MTRSRRPLELTEIHVGRDAFLFDFGRWRRERSRRRWVPKEMRIMASAVDGEPGEVWTVFAVDRERGVLRVARRV